MADQRVKKSRIKQGWLRVILFGIAFILVTALITIPAALLLFSDSMDQIKADPMHALTDLLRGDHLTMIVLLEFVVSVITVLLFRTFIDRKSIASLGLMHTGHTQEIIIGFFVGPMLLGILSLLLMATGRLQWVDITFDPATLFISFGTVVLIAFSEELVFRGYVLSNLLESFAPSPASSSTASSSSASWSASSSSAASSLSASSPAGPISGKWIALLLSALGFAIFHFSSPGLTPLAFLNLFLAGLLLGINYIYTRNLWFSIALHLSWNFFQGPILGSHVSGLNMPSLLQTEMHGDWLVTGGEFGMEGSIINTALTLIATLVLALAFERKYNPQTTQVKVTKPKQQDQTSDTAGALKA